MTDREYDCVAPGREEFGATHAVPAGVQVEVTVAVELTVAVAVRVLDAVAVAVVVGVFD